MLNTSIGTAPCPLLRKRTWAQMRVCLSFRERRAPARPAVGDVVRERGVVVLDDEVSVSQDGEPRRIDVRPLGDGVSVRREVVRLVGRGRRAWGERERGREHLHEPREPASRRRASSDGRRSSGATGSPLPGGTRGPGAAPARRSPTRSVPSRAGCSPNRGWRARSSGRCTSRCGAGAPTRRAHSALRAAPRASPERAASAPATARGASTASGWAGGEVDDEAGAPAGLVVERQRPPLLRDDAPRQPESETGPPAPPHG